MDRNQEEAYYHKIFSFLSAAMVAEITRLKNENISASAINGCKTTFREFLDYNKSLSLLVNGSTTMIDDIAILCTMHGAAPGEAFGQALIKAHGFLSQARFVDMLTTAVPRSISPLTLALLEIPELTPTAYRILNNYILRRNDHEDITAMLSPTVPRLNHYPIIREMRVLIPFYTIVYVNRNVMEDNPAIQGIAAGLSRLFGKEIRETILHKKMELAAGLYRSDMEFLQGLDVFQSQIQRLRHALNERGLSAESPAIRSTFMLLDADKKAGLDMIVLLMQQLISKTLMEPETAAEIRNNMEIGFNLLEKSISAYRSLLTDSAPQKGIDDALIEIILTKVISGSDFLNGTRFLRDIIRDYKDGKYSDRIFGIAMNCLIKYQSGFVRFDNFNERQATLEKSVQNRALMLAKDLKDILNLAMLPERKSMPWPLLSATLFYYRFLLGRILAEKARNHILASQLDNIADSAATPNDFGLFRRTRNNGQSDGGAPTTGFDPIIIKFERLARPYGKSAGELAESCESGSYSEYSTL